MNQIIHYNHCPVCGSADFNTVFTAKDHTVSGKIFTICECRSCTLRFTQDIPDAKAIAPFYKSENYISHSDSSRGIINKLYQRVRKRTLKKKRKLVQYSTGLKTGQLLDIGSGTGAFVNEMKKQGWQVKGLEPGADAVLQAKKIYGLELSGIDQFYKLPDSEYDAITLWHVLEHVHDLQPYMQQLKKLLKEDGKLFIAVPNYTSKDASIYKESWAAYDVPRHLYHFSPGSMRVLLEKNGLKLLDSKPMWFDSFYISMLSSKYRHGSINFAASFFNGLRSNLKAMGNVEKCSSVIYIVGR